MSFFETQKIDQLNDTIEGGLNQDFDGVDRWRVLWMRSVRTTAGPGCDRLVVPASWHGGLGTGANFPEMFSMDFRRLGTDGTI